MYIYVVPPEASYMYTLWNDQIQLINALVSSHPDFIVMRIRLKCTPTAIFK